MTFSKANKPAEDSSPHEHLNDLLDPPTYDMEYHTKLEGLSVYLRECANCIVPARISINDPHSMLLRFEEAYLAILALTKDIAPDIHTRLHEMDRDAHLSLTMVRLGLLAGSEDRPLAATILESLSAVLGSLSPFIAKFDIPGVGTVKLSEALLLDTKAALIRASNLVYSGSKRAKQWWLENQDVLVIDDFYDPRRVGKAFLAGMISNILESVKVAQGIPDNVRTSLISELKSISSDLGSHKTAWNKVLSRLSQCALLLAALITMGADVDDAYSNATKAMQYISRHSLVGFPFTSDPSLPLLPPQPGSIPPQQQRVVSISEGSDDEDGTAMQ